MRCDLRLHVVHRIWWCDIYLPEEGRRRPQVVEVAKKSCARLPSHHPCNPQSPAPSAACLAMQNPFRPENLPCLLCVSLKRSGGPCSWRCLPLSLRHAETADLLPTYVAFVGCAPEAPAASQALHSVAWQLSPALVENCMLARDSILRRLAALWKIWLRMRTAQLLLLLLLQILGSQYGVLPLRMYCGADFYKFCSCYFDVVLSSASTVACTRSFSMHSLLPAHRAEGARGAGE